MHPILGDQLRFRLYLTAWSLAGAMLALLLRVLLDVPWAGALVFGIPLGLAAAPMSLSAWYVCRAMPLSRTGAPRIAATALGAAAVTASLWALGGRFWWQLLDRTGFEMPAGELTRAFTLLLGLGMLGYLLSVTVQYVVQASEETTIAARRALEAQVAHRDAELRALRAQVDPHFLFNSFNSIVGLIASDHDRARDMTLRLAEFLRDSLTLGSARWVSLEREIQLAGQYLSVEQVRFGARLQVETAIEADAGGLAVPPLILQPLVENAVRHGVSTRLEGGTVRVEARRAGSRVLVIVTNPCDLEGRRKGTGFGLDIVRRRLAAAFGPEGALAVEERDGGYRAAVTMPAREMDEEGRNRPAEVRPT
jgi:signal transduction histidine kinase